MVKILFFASLAETASINQIELELGSNKESIDANKLIELLEAKLKNEQLISTDSIKLLIQQLKHDVLMLAVNQKICDWNEPIRDGDEVGFLPPFSGG